MGAHGAIIDLSRGAAQEIGLLGRGRGTVSIEAFDGDPVEVAEAPDSDGGADLAAPRHRRARGRHGARMMASDHRCCHAASMVLARHMVDRRPARHRV